MSNYIVRLIIPNAKNKSKNPIITAEIDKYSRLYPFSIFTIKQKWPRDIASAHLCCWACSRSVTTPWAMPYELNERYEFKMRGIMCSAGCVLRFISDSMEKNMQAFYHTIFDLFHIMYTGNKLLEYEMSPSFTERECFGGTLSDDEFQKRVDALNCNVKKVLDADNVVETKADGMWDLYGGNVIVGKKITAVDYAGEAWRKIIDISRGAESKIIRHISLNAPKTPVKENVSFSQKDIEDLDSWLNGQSLA